MFTMMPASVKVGGVVPATFRDVVLASAPAAFWLLGETTGTTAANEVSGGLAGSYVPTVTLGQAALVPSASGALSAVPAGGYIDIPGSESLLKGTAITYMIAFKGAGSQFALLGHGRGEPYLRANSGRLDFLNSNVEDRLTGATSITNGTNNLAHVTIASTGAIKIYLNGVLDAQTSAYSFDYGSGTKTFKIGADTQLDGTISEKAVTNLSHAAVWTNTALSAATILAQAQAGGFA